MLNPIFWKLQWAQNYAVKMLQDTLNTYISDVLIYYMDSIGHQLKK